MLTITLSLFFLEKVGTFVVAHVFVTNINVIEKECHEGVGGRGGGHRWRICDKHNYKCGFE